MAIGSSIGRLQYKCTAQLIATIITGYSGGDTNSKKLAPAPRTCTLCQIAWLRSLGMDSAIEHCPIRQMQKQHYRCPLYTKHDNGC